MVKWRYACSGPDRSPVYWYDLTWQPASIVLSEWSTKLRSLEWLPISVVKRCETPDISCPDYWIAYDKIERDWYSTEQDYIEAISQVKDAANLFNAGRQTYLRNGWPELRVTEFVHDAEGFAAQINELRGTMRYSEILRTFAGDLAI
jgi:hypothetical protein